MIRSKSKFRWMVVLAALSPLVAAGAAPAFVQDKEKATAQEQKIVLKTYPFSDPDPVPLIGPLYPYFKFRGYSLEGKPQEWRMVRLENPYVRIMVAPDIGGKIWGALEKSTGRNFVYFNNVVKFREIALRGPWTSGGIEFNFGVIGHAPSTATPVDYVIRENQDGSVSCVVGTMDLPSRTEWRVEIRIPKDGAYVETECFWYNPTPFRDSYYHWMTAAADASPDLKFYYPGVNAIGHAGEASTWPLTPNGRDVSAYRNNDFGSSKSYHILGELGEYFGGIWEDSGFGYGHWAPYSDKPGMKLWIWSLARDGEIWRDLLTDRYNKQYVEPQTGLLYNQASSGSTFSPFKHAYFEPYGVARWKEIWFPVKDIGGLVAASMWGALNAVEEGGGDLKIGVSPIRSIDDDLKVTAGGELLFSRRLTLKPMETFVTKIPLKGKSGEITVDLGGGKLRWSSADKERDRLSRPVESPKDYDWNSAEGQFVKGEELNRQRDFAGAMKAFEACVSKEPQHTRALTRLAELHLRKSDFEKARELVLRVLSIDAYDAAANFVHGMTACALGRTADAKDGFGWASRSLEFRSAAYAQLAEISMREGDAARTEDYARRALDFNRFNVPALEILAAALRREGRQAQAGETLSEILKIDPLDHFARFEGYLLDKKPETLRGFTSMIRNEFPQETYLDLSLRYERMGLLEEARTVLEAALSFPAVDYRLAYLYKDKDIKRAEILLSRASAAPPRQVFPYRQEDIPVYRWALEKKGDWKSRYYLALILWNLGRREEAGKLFEECAEQPDYAPFYLVRARFTEEAGGSAPRVLKDITRAVNLDADDWKSWHALIATYEKNGLYSEALQSARTITLKYGDNFVLAMDLAKAFFNAEDYQACLSVMDQTTVLPYEGAREGHDLYRRACLLQAAKVLKKGEYRKAETLAQKAKEWPERLGVGRPYDVDERFEDFLLALAYEKLGDKKKAGEAYAAVAAATEKYRRNWGSAHYAGAVALKKLGRDSEAIRLLGEWRKSRPVTDGIPDWAAAMFQGDVFKAQDILATMTVSASASGNGDRDFAILIKILDAIQN